MLAFTKNAPIQVNSVKVNGNFRTKKDVFEKELQDVTSSSSLQEALKHLESAKDNLRQLGIFDAVDIHMSVDKSKKYNKDGLSYEADIEVTVRESIVPQIRTGAFFQKEMNVKDLKGEMNVLLRNPVGYGEVARLHVGHSIGSFQEFEASLRIPYLTPNRANLNLSASMKENTYGVSSAYKEVIKSSSALVSSRDGRHKLTAEFAFRDELPLHTAFDLNRPKRDPLSISSRLGKLGFDDKEDVLRSISLTSEADLKAGSTTHAKFLPSRDLLELAGPSTKSSLKYSFTDDGRDCISLPTKGQMIDFSVELAVPPGTATFIKAETNFQIHKTLLHPRSGIIGSICSSAGILKSFSTSRLSDRFHLGGPFNLRGFDNYGAESRSAFSNDALGGDRKTSILAMLTTPIPLSFTNPSLSLDNARLLLFLNAGTLSDGRFSSDQSFNQAITSSSGSGDSSSRSGSGIGPVRLLSQIFGTPRLSIGCGFCFVFQPLRVEWTYSIPILKSESDHTKGFQLGFGLSIS